MKPAALMVIGRSVQRAAVHFDPDNCRALLTLFGEMLVELGDAVAKEDAAADLRCREDRASGLDDDLRDVVSRLEVLEGKAVRS